MNIVYANTASTLAHQGDRVVIRPGDPWDGDDPLVEAYPSFFSPHPRAVRSTRTANGFAAVDEAPVERGTRAPGEKRGRVKKTAAPRA